MKEMGSQGDGRNEFGDGMEDRDERWGDGQDDRLDGGRFGDEW